jgi:hypothetical protein
MRSAAQVRREHPEVAVLVFSQYVEEGYAAELLAGSTRKVGYLLKDRSRTSETHKRDRSWPSGSFSAVSSEPTADICRTARAAHGVWAVIGTYDGEHLRNDGVLGV